MQTFVLLVVVVVVAYRRVGDLKQWPATSLRVHWDQLWVQCWVP